MADTKAVLSDLDDTLFDHAFAARSSLEGLHGSLPRFSDGPFEVLEEEYGRLLEEARPDDSPITELRSFRPVEGALEALLGP
ncbi:MAG: hypothetical protein ACRDSJ_13915 [Rubrobacteraceae bacterium]